MLIVCKIFAFVELAVNGSDRFNYKLIYRLAQIAVQLYPAVSVSLLDSLDSTLENEKKLHAVQRTSGDMHTIPELTGEISTNTRGYSQEVGSGDHVSRQENIVRNGHGAVDSSGRRLSNTHAGFTLSHDDDGNSSNISTKDIAGKTVSGLHLPRFSIYTAFDFCPVPWHCLTHALYM